MDCSQCSHPASALVAGRWYCVAHVRDLAQRCLEQQVELGKERERIGNLMDDLALAAPAERTWELLFKEVRRAIFPQEAVGE